METYFAIVMAGQLSTKVVDQIVELIKTAVIGVENILVQTYATAVQTEIFLKVKHTCNESLIEDIISSLGYEVSKICPFQAYRANTIDEIVRSFTPGYEVAKGPEDGIPRIIFKERLVQNLSFCMDRALAAKFPKDDISTLVPNFLTSLKS